MSQSHERQQPRPGKMEIVGKWQQLEAGPPARASAQKVLHGPQFVSVRVVQSSLWCRALVGQAASPKGVATFLLATKHFHLNNAQTHFNSGHVWWRDRWSRIASLAAPG